MTISISIKARRHGAQVTHSDGSVTPIPADSEMTLHIDASNPIIGIAEDKDPPAEPAEAAEKPEAEELDPLKRGDLDPLGDHE